MRNKRPLKERLKDPAVVAMTLGVDLVPIVGMFFFALIMSLKQAAPTWEGSAFEIAAWVSFVLLLPGFWYLLRTISWQNAELDENARLIQELKLQLAARSEEEHPIPMG